jgi:all-trans-retinol dehydrogenase (NAD+)
MNLNSHLFLQTTKAFLPNMLEKDHGHIVTIASLAGHVGISKLVDYCSSKFAAVSWNVLRKKIKHKSLYEILSTFSGWI